MRIFVVLDATGHRIPAIENLGVAGVSTISDLAIVYFRSVKGGVVLAVFGEVEVLHDSSCVAEEGRDELTCWPAARFNRFHRQ